MLAEDGTKDPLALLAVGIAKGAPDEADASLAMCLDEVLHGGPEPALMVGVDRRNAWHPSDGHHRRTDLVAEGHHGVGSRLPAENRPGYDEPIDGRWPREVVEERAVELGLRTPREVS